MNGEGSAISGSGGASSAPDDRAGLDDHSDASALQGDLVSRCVASGKQELRVRVGEPHRAPDSSVRLLQPSCISREDCACLVAAGIVAMAGAFSRCGQTTLGVSPALSDRLRDEFPEVPAPRPPVVVDGPAAGLLG